MNGCRGHFTGMNKKGKKLLKYFQDSYDTDAEGWFNIWYDLVLQIMNNSYLHLAKDLHMMLMDWLNMHNQPAAVRIGCFHTMAGR